MKRQKSALFKSLLALLLCVSMLTGTTFAWFTDSVKSGINTIAAGTLDVEMYHSSAAVQNEKVNAGTKLFMKITVGKGNCTFKQILDVINIYVN